MLVLHLKRYGAANLVRTDRDVLIVAHELTQQGKPCAFHNPSDADVVLGINDVGEYWKKGTGPGYVGEEHIGAMTTAALNSRLLNPKAYQNVAEHSFLSKPIYTLKKEGATVPAPTVTMPHKESHEIIPPTKKIIPPTCTFMEKFHNLKGKDLTSTRFLPFEKYNKNDKEEEMTRLIKEITHSSDPNVIGTKLGELFRVACTVRNWLSSEKYSLDTHSASELRTKLLQSDKIVSFLGLDKEANKDSALRSLMKQATDGKDIQIPQEEKVDHIDDTPHADDSSSVAPGF